MNLSIKVTFAVSNKLGILFCVLEMKLLSVTNEMLSWVKSCWSMFSSFHFHKKIGSLHTKEIHFNHHVTINATTHLRQFKLGTLHNYTLSRSNWLTYSAEFIGIFAVHYHNPYRCPFNHMWKILFVDIFPLIQRTVMRGAFINLFSTKWTNPFNWNCVYTIKPCCVALAFLSFIWLKDYVVTTSFQRYAVICHTHYVYKIERKNCLEGNLSGYSIYNGSLYLFPFLWLYAEETIKFNFFTLLEQRRCCAWLK